MESRTHDQDRRIGRARNRIHLLRPSPAGDPMSTNGKPSRHLRGYGSTHDARRRQVKPLVDSGNAVCSRCGDPISPREQWHLDHTDDRTGYLGVAHAYCNLRAAGIKTAKLHNENTPSRTSRIW